MCRKVYRRVRSKTKVCRSVPPKLKKCAAESCAVKSCAVESDPPLYTINFGIYTLNLCYCNLYTKITNYSDFSSSFVASENKSSKSNIILISIYWLLFIYEIAEQWITLTYRLIKRSVQLTCVIMRRHVIVILKLQQQWNSGNIYWSYCPQY